jgi:ferredoxin-type protein NapH
LKNHINKTFDQKKLQLPAGVFLFVAGMLSMVQVKIHPPILLAERFIQHGGWIEIFFVSCYGAFIAYKMQDRRKTSRWRIISWTVFSIVFFTQLILGIGLSHVFLMTGKLHLPVPAMILAGPVYRNQISVMTILFLSTIILTGPAWCSHLCYFGAIDGLMASRRSNHGKLRYKSPIRHSLFIIVILTTFIFRVFKTDPLYCLLAGILFGLIGLGIILFYSGKKGKMMHCILFCPVGVFVSYAKYLNPFRMKISKSCSFCSACTAVCRYDALTLADITRKRPGNTCTLCGDCLEVCNYGSLHYSLFNLNPNISRQIYLFLTISIHVSFLALARI